MEFSETYCETGILCFKCKERSGIDCAGRGQGESTLCIICFEELIVKDHREQEKHMEKMKLQSQESQSSTKGSSGGTV